MTRDLQVLGYGILFVMPLPYALQYVRFSLRLSSRRSRTPRRYDMSQGKLI